MLLKLCSRAVAGDQHGPWPFCTAPLSKAGSASHMQCPLLLAPNRRAEDTGSCGEQRGEKGMLFQD